MASSQRHGPTISRPTLKHQDYTVGWVCALPKEQTAATSMLDEIHQSLPKPAHDNNTYTLGRIGRHNVVIACLPWGQYGTIPAAKVANWMASTFPSIRVGLMVGIGGGIPPKVRLGDVVISTPTNDSPCVIQWDMGKTEDGGQFKRTGNLNNPPGALLTAVAKLDTANMLHGNKIKSHLEDAMQRFPNLKSIYSWHGSLIDPLDSITEIGQSGLWGSISVFWWKLVHFIMVFAGWTTLFAMRPKAESTNEEMIEKDSEGRNINAHQPKVHYGLIASGNQVIKDAPTRDRLNRMLGGDVLCVEMEAAGLMNDFPCIVIRGISDYADAQKNKTWQEYAAAVAAAYAKELLDFIEPTDIANAQEARLICTVEGIAADTRVILQRQEQQVTNQIQQLQNERLLQLSAWLTPLTPAARQHENQKQRVHGSGTWVLEDQTFKDWTSAITSKPVIYCYGDPGAVDFLAEKAARNPKDGLAYVYCDYRDQDGQQAVHIVGAILQQLMQQALEGNAHLPPDVWQLYDERGKSKASFSLTDARFLLRVISESFERVYICIDALDELVDPQSVLNVFHNWPFSLRLLITGRPHVRGIIEKSLETVGDISIRAHDKDILLFVDREIGGSSDLEPRAMNYTLRKHIAEKLIESAAGVFLLPVLQIRAVLENITLRDREESLTKLPSNLGDAFAGSFERIQSQPSARAQRAMRIIAWVHLAKRRIRLNELLCILTVREGDTTFDLDGVPVRETVLDCCHGLVIVDRETTGVRLVHYSLEEHLQRHKDIFSIAREEWHGRLATTCLTFLMLPSRATEINDVVHHLQSSFVPYAALQWGHHLRQHGKLRISLLEIAKRYLDTGWKTVPAALTLLYRQMGTRSFDSTTSNPKMLPLHVGAFLGLDEVIKSLLSTENPNLRDARCMTPLTWAAREGYKNVAQLLIENGADVNWIDLDSRSPLTWASKNGHVEVASLLLKHGAQVDYTDRKTGTTPLSWACTEGYEAVARLLLEHGAQVDFLNIRYGRTPLSWTAKAGHTEVVRLLISYGADVNWEDKFGRSPLALAATHGHEATAQLLLEHGAKVDLGDNRNGTTPLSWAAMAGHLNVVRLLLEHGAQINSSNNETRTPLFWAAEHEHEAVVRLLLEHGAEVNFVDTRLGQTPLSWACEFAYTDIAKVLLEYGADVNWDDVVGRTALTWASASGHAALVQMLLVHGARVDCLDDSRQTPLSKAATNGHEEVAELLLKHGADVNWEDKDGRSPLLIAHQSDYQAVVRLLLEYGARPPDKNDILVRDVPEVE